MQSNELQPTGTSQRLTVTSASAVTFATFETEAEYIFGECQDNPIRYTMDGTDPTATTGHRLVAGDIFLWHVNLAKVCRFITESGTATLYATELRGD